MKGLHKGPTLSPPKKESSYATAEHRALLQYVHACLPS